MKFRANAELLREILGGSIQLGILLRTPREMSDRIPEISIKKAWKESLKDFWRNPRRNVGKFPRKYLGRICFGNTNRNLKKKPWRNVKQLLRKQYTEMFCNFQDFNFKSTVI